MEIKEQVIKKLDSGDYRGAVESILEEMRNLSQDSKADDVSKEIEEILNKVFNIPNINWGKADKEQKWELFK